MIDADTKPLATEYPEQQNDPVEDLDRAATPETKPKPASSVKIGKYPVIFRKYFPVYKLFNIYLARCPRGHKMSTINTKVSVQIHHKIRKIFRLTGC